jgi:hypothetical protein
MIPGAGPVRGIDGSSPERGACDDMGRPSPYPRPFRSRRGTTVVETAIVLPVFLLFVLGIIEFGHAQMVKNVLRSACRAGARLGSTEGNTTADVEARVREELGSAINPNRVVVFVKNADVYDQGGDVPTSGAALEALPDIELGNAEARQLFLVRAKIDYNDVAVLPMSIPYLGDYLSGLVLEGQAFMRHE